MGEIAATDLIDDTAQLARECVIRARANDLTRQYPIRYSGAMKIETTPEYDRWIDGLRDLAGRARIQARIERLAAGNPGQMRDLDGGLSELKIDVGPGYRVYFTQRGGVLILLLCGGDKSTQQADIRLARKLIKGL